MIATPNPRLSFDGNLHGPVNSARARRVGLAGLFVAALAVGLLGIGNPTPWMDEAATVTAVSRDWLGVTDLFTGPDAPLTPYYLIAKLFTSALTALPTLTVLRLLSAVAAAVAVGAVYTMVTRRAGVVAGLLSAGLLISVPGFSRYAQEARPYSWLLMMTTLAWLAWDRWQRPAEASHLQHGWLSLTRESAWGGLRYVLALAGTVLIHVFGVFHWVAQLLADLTGHAGSMRSRVRRLGPPLTAMVLSLALIGFPLALAILRGTGAEKKANTSILTIAKVTARTVVVNGSEWGAVPILALAGSAVVLLAFRIPAVARYRDLTRVLAIWYAVPLGLNWTVALVRSPLLRSRYMIPSIAPLAGLAAVGMLAIATLLHQHFGPARVARDHRARPLLAVAIPAVVLALVCGVHLAATFRQQIRLRQPAGHGVRLSGLEKRLDQVFRDDPAMPLAVTPPARAALFRVVRPDWGEREVLHTLEPSGPRVWPTRRSPEKVRESLIGVDELVWLWPDDKDGAPTEPPKTLAQNGFVLASIEHLGTWWFCVLRR